MPDPRYFNTLIDATFLHSTGGPEGTAVNEIQKLHDNGDCLLLLAHSVRAEIEHHKTPAEVKRRAARFIYSRPVQLTAPEQATHARFRALMQGNAKPGKHAKDAFHLVESAKYGLFFITSDTRLLKKADEIYVMLPPFRVVKPTSFLEAYYQALEP